MFKDLEKYELKALRYAEKHGIVEYEVKDNKMIYIENYPNEGTYEHVINLDTMKDSVTRLNGPIWENKNLKRGTRMKLATEGKHLKEAESDYITIGGKRYPKDMTSYNPNLSADEVSREANRRREREIADEKAEQERKEAEARKAKMIEASKDKIDEINKLIDSGKDVVEAFFEVLVPSSGKADTVAGEIARAINRLGYRWYNDGDIFCLGYGLETTASSAGYLAEVVEDKSVGDLIENEVTALGDYYPTDEDIIDKHYESFMNTLVKKVGDYLLNNLDLIAEENDIDSRQDNDTTLEIIDNQPLYDFEIDIPYELQRHIEEGNISDRDLAWELESWEGLGSPGSTIEIGYRGGYAVIKDVTFEDYNRMIHENIESWLDNYAQELTEEYGDPDNQDEDEDEDYDEYDESLKSSKRSKKESIERRRKLSESNNQGLVAVFFNDDGYSPAGNDGTFISDIKSPQALVSRINSKDFVKKTKYPNFIILSYSEWDRMTGSNYEKLDSYIKRALKSNKYYTQKTIKTESIENNDNLKIAADKLNSKTNNEINFTVQEVYKDYGAGIKWNTIIANTDDSNWQILDTVTHREILNGNIDSTVDDILKGSLYQKYLKTDDEEDLDNEDWFIFGLPEAKKYGKQIQKALSGKTVSKRKDKAEEPGGLIYEADKLGLNMWDLLRALEGMCYLRMADEIDDSTYKIK